VIYVSLWQYISLLGPSDCNQVGNEYHFTGVFGPKVGNTIHFLPEKMSEPWVWACILSDIALI